MIAIVDYGVGNVSSLKCSFSAIGEDAVITSDETVIDSADKIILPGVGAFRDAAQKLNSTGLKKCLLDAVSKGKYLMGICLGMQLLFDKSYEYGEYDGLGLIPGEVVPMSDYIDKNLKIPQMGWNSLDFGKNKHSLFKYINDGDYVYFVHSYFAYNCEEHIIAKTDYSFPITAAVASGNVLGCQFHPEKSGEVGLKILKAFCEME